MNTIVPDALTKDISPADCIELIIDCVRYKKYLAWAECCVRYLGPEFGRLFINEVRTTTKSPTHRSRLIDLMAVAGVTLTPLEVTTLVNDRACKCKTVRDALTRLLAKRGLDGHPIGQARAAGLLSALELKLPRRV